MSAPPKGDTIAASGEFNGSRKKPLSELEIDKDAHDAKAGRGESRANIYKDKTTGKYYLWDGKAISARAPI